MKKNYWKRSCNAQPCSPEPGMAISICSSPATAKCRCASGWVSLKPSWVSGLNWVRAWGARSGRVKNRCWSMTIAPGRDGFPTSLWMSCTLLWVSRLRIAMDFTVSSGWPVSDAARHSRLKISLFCNFLLSWPWLPLTKANCMRMSGENWLNENEPKRLYVKARNAIDYYWNPPRIPSWFITWAARPLTWIQLLNKHLVLRASRFLAKPLILCPRKAGRRHETPSTICSRAKKFNCSKLNGSPKTAGFWMFRSVQRFTGTRRANRWAILLSCGISVPRRRQRKF